ncbi:hypothetical protein SAMN05216436_11723 [bacterium A37T11]|nr:hypothetical protein SAMN05216436_11723 [bacterium A37T11]
MRSVILFLTLAVPLGVFGQSPLNYPSSIRISGEVGKRLDASYENRILAQSVDELVEPFKHHTETRGWQTEFWGKWFTSAVLAYRYKPEPRLKVVLDNAVAKLEATQTPDGYIGNYADSSRLKQWDIWGRKYVMLGMLDYHDLTGDKKSLKVAAKVADNLINDLAKTDGIIVTKGNYRGMAASSVLEPICLLYVRTKNKKYLDFAETIVTQWETPEGPQLISKAGENVGKRFPKPQNWYSWEQGQKAYEMMSCYEGLLELYRITGKNDYKIAVEKTWQNIYDTEINVAGSGAAVEMWFGGKVYQAGHVNHYQETCVGVTWLKLSHQLFRLTGESKYADAVEQTFYNAILAAMSADGFHWAKYTPLAGQRLPGSGQCGMSLNCCEASGPRGLFNMPLHAVMHDKDGLVVSYFLPGEYTLNTPGGQEAHLQQQTSYPETGTVKIILALPKVESMSIRLRIPAWSKQTSLTVNGEQIAVQPGKFAIIKRTWKSGDQLELNLDMRGRVMKVDEGLQKAIMRGPILLARDSRLQGAPMGIVLNPSADKDGYIVLTPSKEKQADVWLQYSASFMPESYTEGGAKPVQADLCDYASAGNGTESSVYNVWLPQLTDPKNL